MFLRFADGRPFATGTAHYISNLASEASSRIALEVEIEGQQTTARVDTAAPYMICEAELVNQLGLGAAEDTVTVRIHGVPVEGGLHRVYLSVLADEGEDLTIDATLFVPLKPYTYPSFLGLTNCLESIYFAVDPFEETFYFGERSE